MERFFVRTAPDRAEQSSEPSTDPPSTRLVRQMPLQISRQHLGTGIPVAWILLQTLQADRFQVPIYLGIQQPRWGRLVLQHLQQRVHRGLSAERGPARQEFVQQGP